MTTTAKIALGLVAVLGIAVFALTRIHTTTYPNTPAAPEAVNTGTAVQAPSASSSAVNSHGAATSSKASPAVPAASSAKSSVKITKAPVPHTTQPVQPAPTTPSQTVFTTNTSAGVLHVNSIPLLAGGTAHMGTSVPISYLQVVNESTSTVAIHGFIVRERGTAPDVSVVGFSSVDDKGGSRAAVGGVEGASPLTQGVAHVPSTAVLAPGQMKLFTIKAQLSVAAQAGTTLILDVAGVDATIPTRAAFPIPGTTWTISP